MSSIAFLVSSAECPESNSVKPIRIIRLLKSAFVTKVARPRNSLLVTEHVQPSAIRQIEAASHSISLMVEVSCNSNALIRSYRNSLYDGSLIFGSKIGQKVGSSSCDIGTLVLQNHVRNLKSSTETGFVVFSLLTSVRYAFIQLSHFSLYFLLSLGLQ